MWKSTSSSGWEYFIVWEDLGLSPMYAKLYVIFNICIILMKWLNVSSDNVILKL